MYETHQTKAIYFDGLSARAHDVLVRLEQGGLAIYAQTDGAPLARWPVDAIRAPEGVDLNVRNEARLVPNWESEERLRISDADFLRILKRRLPRLHDKPPRNNRMARKALLWSAGAIGSLAFIVFVAVPALAPQIAALIPQEREIAFGERVFDLTETIGLHNGVCESEEGNAALDNMVARVTEGLELRIPLNVSVVRSAVPNAVAMPGGRILLFSPLIRDAETAEEVAGVLAHEIGHVQEAHPTREAIRASAATATIGLIFGDFAGASVIVFAGDRLINTSYSREAEHDADHFAINRLKDVGLSPIELSNFMHRLGEEVGDDSLFDGWFATHPGFAERTEILSAAAEGVEPGAPVLTDDEWSALRTICFNADRDDEQGEEDQGVLDDESTVSEQQEE